MDVKVDFGRTLVESGNSGQNDEMCCLCRYIVSFLYRPTYKLYILNKVYKNKIKLESRKRLQMFSIKYNS
jgi:hypothetical protein